MCAPLFPQPPSILISILILTVVQWLYMYDTDISSSTAALHSYYSNNMIRTKYFFRDSTVVQWALSPTTR